MATGPALIIAIDEKRYAGAELPLFTGLHVAIAPGSVTAVLGPSGIGKSTLLRMVAGIDREFTGAVTVAGKAAHEAPAPGFLFQDPRLLPWLTVFDNVRTARKGIDASHAQAALAKTGLAGEAELYPHQLSGGMQRRAALARALALNAGLLLLDEPFVSLDRALVGEMQELVASIIAAERPTTLLVSHMPEDAARLADRVLVLSRRQGTIVADLALPAPLATRDRGIVERYVEMIEAATEYRHIRAE